MTYVQKKMRLNVHRVVRIPRNKDLFEMYHPTDTSTDYFGSTPSEPVDAPDAMSKNELLQAGINAAKQDAAERARKAAEERKKQQEKEKTAETSDSENNS